MKKAFLVLLLLFFSHIHSRAQLSNPDYQAQSKKINRLLSERSLKFDQYQTSLSERSGIFGLKTKKDMQKSIDILTGIVQNDNTILSETKALLEYKDLEKNQVESKATDAELQIKGYAKAITKLKEQNDLLLARSAALQKQKDWYNYGMLITGILMAVLLLSGFKKKSRTLKTPG